MAVIGVRIEGDVGHQADVGNFGLDRAGRPAHQIVRIDRLFALRRARLRVGVRKKREGRDAEIAGLAGGLHRRIGRETMDPRHGGHRLAQILAVF